MRNGASRDPQGRITRGLRGRLQHRQVLVEFEGSDLGAVPLLRLLLVAEEVASLPAGLGRLLSIQAAATEGRCLLVDAGVSRPPSDGPEDSPALPPAVDNPLPPLMPHGRTILHKGVPGSGSTG